MSILLFTQTNSNEYSSHSSWSWPTVRLGKALQLLHRRGSEFTIEEVGPVDRREGNVMATSWELGQTDSSEESKEEKEKKKKKEAADESADKSAVPEARLKYGDFRVFLMCDKTSPDSA